MNGSYLRLEEHLVHIEHDDKKLLITEGFLKLLFRHLQVLSQLFYSYSELDDPTARYVMKIITKFDGAATLVLGYAWCSDSARRTNTVAINTFHFSV